MSSVSKSCYVNIRDLRRIRNVIDHTTAPKVATYLSLSLLLLYCSFFPLLKFTVFNLFSTLLPVPSFELQTCTVLQQSTPILKYLQKLKINQRIQCEVLCLTHKSLKTGISSYLRSLTIFAHSGDPMVVYVMQDGA